MAAAVMSNGDAALGNNSSHAQGTDGDPFTDRSTSSFPRPHRYSSFLDSDSHDIQYSSSPGHARRILEGHMQENERRLQQTQKLGTSLLHQQSGLSEKLKELDQKQEQGEVPTELRETLAQLEREHEDVGKEVARALMPKSRAVSAEENPTIESSVYSSQATGSPSKIIAPSRRHRNQPSNRAGDLQFAADISTSLLAQVRQLQAAVAERDEMLKNAHAEHSKYEQDHSGLTQRLRNLDENEQRYKDENWNLETQNHELSTAARGAAEREKRLNATLAAALAEKSRVQNESDEMTQAHGKLTEEHVAARKAHDTEIHALKRSMDQGDTEKVSLQSKIDELTSQNQELAQAITARFRGHEANIEPISGDEQDEDLRGLSTPEHSPPPSPTKATPRHPGLESETLRSSLHHSHRMIQNLKNNIHREKTEKLELKRMLQDARDELEQNRGLGSGSKRHKTKDSVRRPGRPDMLGGNRKGRTDVELDEEDWEEHESLTPSHGRRVISVPGAFNQSNTDVSDAYQTTDFEGAFETADEKHVTESDDFQTGAESIAGDSTDDLTETEDTGNRVPGQSGSKGAKSSLRFKNAGNRTSFMSTASTSAGEDEEGAQTPVMAQNPHKFHLKNGRQSMRQSREDNGTPINQRTVSIIAGSSPATTINNSSPAAPEQSLFDQLADFDEVASDRYSTPGRDSIASAKSTPYMATTMSRRDTSVLRPASEAKPVMVDAGTMTEIGEPQAALQAAVFATPPSLLSSAAWTGAATGTPIAPPPSDFPLPPSLPQSPVRRADMSTQYTPQRSLHESPARNIAKFVTPPKTVWDEAQEAEIVHPEDQSEAGHTSRGFQYSSILTQNNVPVSPPRATTEAAELKPHNYSAISTLQTEPLSPQAKVLASGNSAQRQEHHTPSSAEKMGTGAVAGGLLASAAAAIGLSRSKDSPKPVIAEDETSETPSTGSRNMQGQRPLSMISENTAGRSPPKSAALVAPGKVVSMCSADQASQTTLTAQHIEQALLSKSEAPRPASSTTPRPVGVVANPDSMPSTPITSPTKRPASASSHRTSSLLSQQHPPLPPDHRSAIEKAGGRVPTRDSTTNQAAVIMGPPAMPASAMRRPRTPGESSIRSPTRDSTVIRVSHPNRHARAGTHSSQVSRRSSVSSFASELDERFNIRPEAQAASHGFEAAPGTDPRMIQAITQTMIGEFLWKYTRKAGRSEMSGNRHRRYFWVHPYTKTLYWSDQDPQHAGRNELTAKSVAIESVRVLTDDNPMPPGLHRKSLEVTTPGRKVKFTASTGQRHETWFNALSYLLLRGDQDPNATYAAGGNEITRDDINEFNVAGAGYDARLVPSGSRVSMSSYNSRTTRGTSTNRNSVRQSLPAGVTINQNAVRQSAQPQNATGIASTSSRLSRADQPREADKDRTLRAGSTSRLSRMIGSVTGRTSRSMSRVDTGKERETSSIYNASVVSAGRRDSAEEMRQDMLRQEREGLGGQLEDVRACCDGKFPWSH